MNALREIKARLQLSSIFAETRLSPLLTMILGLLAATTVFAALFATYALVGPLGSEAETTAPEWNPPTLEIGELAPPKPDSAYEQSLTRPIFSKNRKPMPKSAGRPTEALATGDGPVGVTVNAIVKRGKRSQAFVVSSETPEGEWKKVGDSIESWTISAIGSDDLTVTNGDKAAKLKLYSDVAPDEPPGAATPPGYPTAPTLPVPPPQTIPPPEQPPPPPDAPPADPAQP